MITLKDATKIRKKIVPKLIFSGLIFFPVIFLALYYLTAKYIESMGGGVRLSIYGIHMLCLLALLICIGIGGTNVFRYVFRGKREFSSLRKYFGEPRLSKERAAAMYPEIPSKLLFSEPTGIVLGKVGLGSFFTRYLCIDPRDKAIANHIAILGNSSSGKTSGPILSSLISTNLTRSPITYLVIDTKPELAELSTVGDQWCYVLNPQDRTCYGWDAYWNISKESPQDDVYSTMKSISEVLIPEVSEQNAFFVNSARNILCATLMFEYQFGRTFIESLRILLKSELTDYIKTIKSITNENHRIYMLLAEFGKSEDKSNALNDIRKTLKERLDVFTRDDVEWFFDTKINKQICSPLDLDAGKSMFLSIKRADLKQYNVLFRLIISQSIEHLSRRNDDDPNKRPVVIILDEFTNLGAKIPSYCENLGFIRSKKVTFVTIFQQYSQLEALYGKEQARTILNMGHQLLLSLEDVELGKQFSDKAGEFWQERVDHKRVGTIVKTKVDGEHVSMAKERCLRVMDDFASLGPRFESIAFINGSEYYRFSKCRYYLEPKLRERAEECKRINQAKKYGYKQEEEK